MKNIRSIILLAALALGSTAAQADPFSVARVALVGGTATFELAMDKPRIDECDIPGKTLNLVIASIETAKGGLIPYGSGCWMAGIDGDIYMLVKSYEDGRIFEKVLNNSNFTPVEAPAKIIAAAVGKYDDGQLLLIQLTDKVDPKCEANYGRVAYVSGTKAKHACWVKGREEVVLWTDTAQPNVYGSAQPDIILDAVKFEKTSDFKSWN